MSEFNSFSEQFFEKKQAMRPTLRTWLKHLILFFITFITCTIVGTIQPFGIQTLLPDINPQTWTEFGQMIPTLPYLYIQNVYEICVNIWNEPGYLQYGLSFSISFLFILTCHEMGHYVACRIYKVDATLPYFLPTPPMIGPAGTLGAFIKIISPMPSRKAVFDIGVAGPIAGFIAMIPIAIIAVITTKAAPQTTPSPSDLQLVFSDPLFYKFLAYLGGIDLSQPINANPFYFATWLGLLVTALNLIPSGQLDGGHALYAVFGENVHKWTGRIAFVAMTLFSILGMYFYSSPSGILFAIILAVMLRVGHPEPYDKSPLDINRKIIAFLTLIIFLLCFVPFPIQIQ